MAIPFGANFTFMAEVYAKFLENPQSVDSSWRDFFSQISDDGTSLLRDLDGVSWPERASPVIEAA